MALWINNDNRHLFSYPYLGQYLPVNTEEYKNLGPKGLLSNVNMDIANSNFVDKIMPLDMADKVHIFESQAYSLLEGAETMQDKSDACNSIVGKLRGLDVLSKDFLFFPVNSKERNHWLLAIVAFPGLIVNGKLESIKMPYRIDQNIAKFAKIERQPLMKKSCILVMDSMRQSHLNDVAEIATNLRQLLNFVASKTGLQVKFDEANMPCHYPHVPQQPPNNGWDCGLYVIETIQHSIKDPIIDFTNAIDKSNWFTQDTIEDRRKKLVKLFQSLYKTLTKGNVNYLPQLIDPSAPSPLNDIIESQFPKRMKLEIKMEKD